LSSLNEHLVTVEGHGRLPFRGDCPLCRAERLSGSIAPAPLVSRRAQAGLAAAVLLASNAAAPTSAFAQKEPDVEHEGQAPDAVIPSEGGDEATDPEFDPGVGLPPDAGSPPDDGEAVDENEAVEGDTLIDPVALEERREDAVVPADPQPPRSDAERRNTSAQPGAPPAPTAPAAPPETSTDPPLPAAHFVEPRPAGAEAGRSAAYGVVVERSRSLPAKAAPPAPQHVPVSTEQPPALGETPAPSARGDTSRASGPRHVVRPGETLWSIARDLLGPDASTAAIAREVHRIWDLNADTIGTGDPDLIVPGQVLVLR
jgi:hypothetical protein